MSHVGPAPLHDLLVPEVLREVDGAVGQHQPEIARRTRAEPSRSHAHAGQEQRSEDEQAPSTPW